MIQNSNFIEVSTPDAKSEGDDAGLLEFINNRSKIEDLLNICDGFHQNCSEAFASNILGSTNYSTLEP